VCSSDLVRVIILMLVFVFDPLAVLMFIAVNQSVKPKITIEPVVEKPSNLMNLSFDDSVTGVDDTDSILRNMYTGVEHRVRLK